MSRGNQEALIMLSSFAGCMGNLMATNAFARVDLRRRIHDIFDQTCLTIHHWPSDRSESIPGMTEKIKAWSDAMGKNQDRLSSATIIYMASRILADLEDRIKNRWKREQLAKLRELFQPLEDYVDPDKRNFVAFEEGDRMLDLSEYLIKEEA